jgi:hypothetical protein
MSRSSPPAGPNRCKALMINVSGVPSIFAANAVPASTTPSLVTNCGRKSIPDRTIGGLSLGTLVGLEFAVPDDPVGDDPVVDDPIRDDLVVDDPVRDDGS